MYKIVKVNLNSVPTTTSNGQLEYNLPDGFMVDGIINKTEDSITLIIKPDINHMANNYVGPLRYNDNNSLVDLYGSLVEIAPSNPTFTQTDAPVFTRTR